MVTPITRIRDLVSKRSGLDLREDNDRRFRRKLKEMWESLGLNDEAEYFDFLENHPSGWWELNKFLNRLAIKETSFFRYQPHFDLFMSVILPELIRDKNTAGDKHLKFWSAGCSTGEEPYSIAICILEGISDPEDYEIEIVGSDINTESLCHAESGRYKEWSFKDCPDEIRRRYFRRTDDEYVIDKRINGMVDFHVINLATDIYPKGFDIIFCRNVTMYFKDEARRTVWRNLRYSMNPNGYLLTGESECISDKSIGLEPINIGNTTVYKRVTGTNKLLK